MTSGETRRIPVLIIGAGGIAASSHMRALQAHEDRVEVVGVADVVRSRAEQFAERFALPSAFDDVGDALRTAQPLLTHICTPPSSHAPTVRACLEAGSWVWCEKPPTLTLREYDNVTDHERDGGPYAAYVFQHRFGSAGRHIKSALDSNAFGKPLVAVCNTLWFRPQTYFDVPWRGRWDTEGGGPTMGHGIHQMDLMLHLLGDWVEVRAVAPTLVRDVATEDVSAAVVTMSSGVVMTVVNSVLSPREETYLRIDCADATIEVTHLYGYDDTDWRITAAPHVDDDERIAGWQPVGNIRSAHAAALGDVLDAIDAGVRPPTSGAAGRVALELIAGIYASAFTGRAVRRDELVPGNQFYDSMNGQPTKSAEQIGA